MAKDLFYRLDLNLLKTFLVLPQELNMRKASERLFVSQPAISQSLQRLRDHFNDPLFVKSKNGLKATDYAEKLADRVIPILDSLHSVLHEDLTIPLSELNQTIKISLSPQVLCTLSGTLVQRLKKEAPNIELQLLSWNGSTISDICNGKINLGVHYDILSAPKELISEHLVDVNLAVIVRKGHPIKGQVTTVKEFSEYEIASLIIPGWNEKISRSEEVISDKGFTFKPGFRSEYPMAVLDVISHSDMCFPTVALFPIRSYPEFRVIRLETEHELESLALNSYFHRKNQQSPVIQWLNHVILELLEDQKTN